MTILSTPYSGGTQARPGRCDKTIARSLRTRPRRRSRRLAWLPCFRFGRGLAVTSASAVPEPWSRHVPSLISREGSRARIRCLVEAESARADQSCIVRARKSRVATLTNLGVEEEDFASFIQADVTVTIDQRTVAATEGALRASRRRSWYLPGSRKGLYAASSRGCEARYFELSRLVVLIWMLDLFAEWEGSHRGHRGFARPPRRSLRRHPLKANWNIL